MSNVDTYKSSSIEGMGTISSTAYVSYTSVDHYKWLLKRKECWSNNGVTEKKVTDKESSAHTRVDHNKWLLRKTECWIKDKLPISDNTSKLMVTEKEVTDKESFNPAK